MKNNNLAELLDKYYAGLTTKEEEQWLKHQAPLLPPDDNIFYNSVQESKTAFPQSFDEFAAEHNLHTEEEEETAPVRVLKFTFFKYAASVILALGVAGLAYYFINKDKNTITENIYANNQQDTPINKQVIKLPESTEDNTIQQASVKPQTNTSIIAAVNRPKKKTNIVKPAVQPYEESIVVFVNGKPVRDNEEALRIAGESISAVTKNISTTFNDVK